MTERSVAEVLELVSQLSTSDKLGLVAEVINDLEGPEDEAWSSAWRAELDRRMAEPGERTGASWEEVRQRALSSIEKP
jgi:putative addiction module component (TIGR02574 family)